MMLLVGSLTAAYSFENCCKTMKAPLPDNEACRLDTLHQYEILDTPPKQPSTILPA